MFTKLKKINNNFKMSYEEQIDKSLEAISFLTHAPIDKKNQYLVHFDIHSILDLITSKTIRISGGEIRNRSNYNRRIHY